MCSNFFSVIFQYCYFLFDLFPSYSHILRVFHALTEGSYNGHLVQIISTFNQTEVY
jgi:hypothetical protein